MVCKTKIDCILEFQFGQKTFHQSLPVKTQANNSGKEDSEVEKEDVIANVKSESFCLPEYKMFDLWLSKYLLILLNMGWHPKKWNLRIIRHNSRRITDIIMSWVLSSMRPSRFHSFFMHYLLAGTHCQYSIELSSFPVCKAYGSSVPI